LSVYFGLVLLLVALHLFFLFVPLQTVLPEQASIFTWPALILISALGFVGVWAASKTGFPEMWDTTISNQQRFLMPALLGLGLGFVAVGIARFQPLGQIDVAFPLSLPFYLYGGIVSEILLRLFLLPVPLWFLSSLLLRGRWQSPIFWGLAVITALLVPWDALGGLFQRGLLNQGIPVGVWVFVAFAFSVNVLVAYEYRTFGFIAPVMLRLSYYLVWHILF